MDQHLRTDRAAGRRVVPFLALVFALSAVFYLLGPRIGGLSALTGAEVPGSALMFVCPAIAAVLLVHRQGADGGVRHWLRASFRRPGAERAAWYAPTVLLLPAIMGVSYLVARCQGIVLPHPRVAWSTAPTLVVVYLVSALCEELGWTAYATEPLQRRCGALGAAVTIGSAWAAWHVIPYWQAGHPASWIAWQCLFTVAFRIVLMWLYNNTRNSLAATVLGHASYDVAWSLFPNAGSQYDPAVTGILTTLVAMGAALDLLLHSPGKRPSR